MKFDLTKKIINNSHVIYLSIIIQPNVSVHMIESLNKFPSPKVLIGPTAAIYVNVEED